MNTFKSTSLKALSVGLLFSIASANALPAWMALPSRESISSNWNAASARLQGAYTASGKGLQDAWNGLNRQNAENAVAQGRDFVVNHKLYTALGVAAVAAAIAAICLYPKADKSEAKN